MPDKNQQQSPSNAELLDKITELTNQNSELREQFSATKAELAESQRYRRQFEEMQEKHASERRESHRTAIKDRFERAVKSKAILPAVRERFYKRFDVLEGKDIERISLADVDEYIAENPNPTAPRTQTVQTLVGTFTDDERAMIGALPDRQLFIRSMKRVREQGLDPQNWQHLFRASQEILRSDPTLAESYRMLPDNLANGHYE